MSRMSTTPMRLTKRKTNIMTMYRLAASAGRYGDRRSLALAVIGTAGAFGYRALWFIKFPNQPPPVIKADAGPRSSQRRPAKIHNSTNSLPIA